MRITRWFYGVMMVLGTILPWYFFAQFISEEGLNIPLFINSWFANSAAAGFSTDALLSIVVFWVWSYADARRHNIHRWWLVLPATLTVGLSLALPMYLYMRSEV